MVSTAAKTPSPLAMSLLLLLLLLGITFPQNVTATAVVRTETVLDSAVIIRTASAPTSRQPGDQATPAKGWTLSNTNGSIEVPATVPGSVHLVRSTKP